MTSPEISSVLGFPVLVQRTSRYWNEQPEGMLQSSFLASKACFARLQACMTGLHLLSCTCCQDRHACMQTPSAIKTGAVHTVPSACVTMLGFDPLGNQNHIIFHKWLTGICEWRCHHQAKALRRTCWKHTHNGYEGNYRDQTIHSKAQMEKHKCGKSHNSRAGIRCTALETQGIMAVQQHHTHLGLGCELS